MLVARIAPVALLILVSGTPAAQIVVDPSRSVGPKIRHWAWDLKGARGLTRSSAAARTLYAGSTNADMVRIPMYAQAHRADGSVDAPQYTQVLQSIGQIRAVKPSVKIFASLKLLGATTFPTWVESSADGRIFSNRVKKPDPARYGRLMADYIQFLRSQGLRVDYFGPGNETEFALDAPRWAASVRIARNLLASRGVEARFRDFQNVGPCSFFVRDAIQFSRDLFSSGGLGELHIASAHYYPHLTVDNATSWRSLKLVSGNLPLWHTELHMNPRTTGNVGQMRQGLATFFDANRAGCVGFAWWQGGASATSVDDVLKREVVRTTYRARPIFIDSGVVHPRTSLTANLQAAYLRRDVVHIWAVRQQASPGTLRYRFLAGDLGKRPVATWWSSQDNVLTSGESGALRGTVAADRKSFTVLVPGSSIVRITVKLKLAKQVGTVGIR